MGCVQPASGLRARAPATSAAHPPTLQLDEQTAEGAGGNYSSTLSVVTVETGGLSNDHSSKLRLLLVRVCARRMDAQHATHARLGFSPARRPAPQNFGEHGRELISSEIGLRLLEQLCDPGAAVAALAEQGLAPAVAEALLRGVVFKVCVRARAGYAGAAARGRASPLDPPRCTCAAADCAHGECAGARAGGGRRAVRAEERAGG